MSEEDGEVWDILTTVHLDQVTHLSIQSDPTDRTGIRLETLTYVCDRLRGNGYLRM